MFQSSILFSSLSQPSRAIKPRENPSASHTTVTPRVRAFFQFILRIFFFDCHATSLSLARFPRDPSTVSYYRKRTSISHYCGILSFLLRKLQSIVSRASSINFERLFSINHEESSSDKIMRFKKLISQRNNLFHQ